MHRRLSGVIVSAILCWAVAMPVAAQQSKTLAERVNAGVVGLAAGGVNGTYIRVAADLAAVLDDVENLRVVPMIGRGSVQNITDLLYLKGVDLCIVQSDVLSYLKREKVYRGLERRVHYIAKLYNEEFHLLARNDIAGIEDLAGSQVNFGVDGSGTFITASTLFDKLGIDVKPTSFDQALAMEKLKNGEIAAMAYVAGKPTRLFEEVSAADKVRLLEVPYTPELADIYLPAHFNQKDYPRLLDEGSRVNTVAVGAVLAAFNWSPDSPRYRNVARFVEAFFSRFADFQQPPRHQKWTEVSLNAQVPGWTRFKAAGDWLEANAAAPEAQLREAFKKFLEEQQALPGARQLSETQKDELFQLFIRWSREQQE